MPTFERLSTYVWSHTRILTLTTTKNLRGMLVSHLYKGDILDNIRGSFDFIRIRRKCDKFRTENVFDF
jgi:hypothetical protein